MERGQSTMETLDMKVFNEVYRETSVLVTGHTGFKGSWLTLWLKSLGAEITGLGLDSKSQPCHWDLLNLDIIDKRVDIRDAQKVRETINIAKPKIVFHLAAQPLVRQSYSNPTETWSTNVMGTVNLLEACRQQPSVSSIIIITSDKCYENKEWAWGYREIDRLGGHDPYSASKASCELLVASYRKAFFNLPNSPLITTVRAGNVIGGGDWSEDRLIPDLVRAIKGNKTIEIRSPNATRPWQHVLDPINGYVRFAEALYFDEMATGESLNFGPSSSSKCYAVKDILNLLTSYFDKINIEYKASSLGDVESGLLALSPEKANRELSWAARIPVEEAVSLTAEYYRGMQSGSSSLQLMTEQINKFLLQYDTANS